MTILDVLENFFDGEMSPQRAQDLGPRQLDELAERVNEFYATWDPPRSAEAQPLIYSGGWIAGNLEAAVARQYLYGTLVYANAVLIHDPIGEWFDPARTSLEVPPPIRARVGGLTIQGAEAHLLRQEGYYVFRDEPERSRSRVASALTMFSELAPLIRSGIVVPVPHLRYVRERQQAILTATRHDIADHAYLEIIENPIDQAAPRGDRIRGGNIVPQGGVVRGDEGREIGGDASYFLNKTLAIADRCGARYVPPAATDSALLGHKLGKLGEHLRAKKIDLRVVPAIVEAELPFLGQLDAKTLLAIRRDEQAFEDWRADLRAVVRTIETGPEAGEAFEQEARDVLTDVLLPRAREVERAVSRSTVMTAAAKDQALSLAIGTVSTVGAAAALGTPLAPAALLGLGIAAVSRWVYGSIFRDSPSGTRGVLASLIERR